MKLRARHLAALILATPAIVVTPIVLSSSAHADVEAAPLVTTDITAAGRDRALSYWTPERMRRTGADSVERPERIGRPWAGRLPAGVGRLFMVVKQGASGPSADEWCTATAVPSPTSDVVVTAAHCVWPGYTRRDEVIQVSDVVFVPAYAEGEQPYGVFAARSYLFPASYQAESSPDIAMIVLDPAAGRHVAQAAGTQNIAFSAPPDGHASILGYPGSRTARGQILEWCDVPTAPNGDPNQWRAVCDLAGGSSGGPWLTGFQPDTGIGTIYSVTSAGTVDLDEETGDVYTADLSGPKLDSVASDLYEEAGRH
ncbi:trypsin-like serine peptidase [Actinoplanes sp. NPDC049265]|uniref:trypsin-like serine peptidase n=1 Tax=Actinoplanes sp. NPDC049265 TaxID=3363902 RepID=UPI0037194DEA